MCGEAVFSTQITVWFIGLDGLAVGKKTTKRNFNLILLLFFFHSHWSLIRYKQMWIDISGKSVGSRLIIWISGLNSTNCKSSRKRLWGFSSVVHSEVAIGEPLVSLVLTFTGWKVINVSQPLRRQQNIPHNWDTVRVSYRPRMLMYTWKKGNWVVSVAINNWIFIWTWR